MIISTTNDTWSALSAVHSVLAQMVHRDLGSELNEEDFDFICEVENRVSEILQREVG